MSRHSQYSSAKLPIAATIAASAVLAVSGLVAAQANTTYDLNYGQLSFNSGKEFKAGSFSSLLTQSGTANVPSPNMGSGLALNEYVDYYNVATISGQQIDARVTYKAHTKSRDAASTAGNLAFLDKASLETASIAVSDGDWITSTNQLTITLSSANSSIGRKDLVVIDSSNNNLDGLYAIIEEPTNNTEFILVSVAITNDAQADVSNTTATITGWAEDGVTDPMVSSSLSITDGDWTDSSNELAITLAAANNDLAVGDFLELESSNINLEGLYLVKTKTSSTQFVLLSVDIGEDDTSGNIANTTGEVVFLNLNPADGANNSKNPYLRHDFYWSSHSTPATDRFVQYEIKFYTNLASSPQNPQAVTLQNVRFSIYDIDNSQFVGVEGFTNYYLSNTGSILTATVSNGFLEVRASATSTSAEDSYTKGRATFEFASVADFEIQLGLGSTSSSSSSSYELDFGPGVGGATWTIGGVSQIGAAVANPVVETAPAPYTGPVPVSLSVACAPAGVASTAVLSGERLNTITSAEVDGKPITVSEVSASSVKLAIPALTAGTFSVVYTSSFGRLTHQDSLRVCAASATPTPPSVNPGTGAPFEAQRLFANYRGDRGPVIARDRAAITAFINQYKGITTVRCVGSTSGVPAKSTDPALAQTRAKNACDIVKRLVPNATISLETSTGKGIGQRFRSVTIFITGTN